MLVLRARRKAAPARTRIRKDSRCGQDSSAPPAAREDPSGIGVEEPPDEDHRDEEKEADGRFSDEGAARGGVRVR